jgi:hypothetical protein
MMDFESEGRIDACNEVSTRSDSDGVYRWRDPVATAPGTDLKAQEPINQ